MITRSTGVRQSWIEHLYNSSTFQGSLMKFVPVVEIVQIHCIFRGSSVISNAARGQNTLARFVVVIVTAHRGVMLLDGLPGQRLRVFLYPRFELRIRRLVLLDVSSHRLFLESERGKSHRIEAFAHGRITRSKFTRRLQRDLLPKTREMHNAKWTGNAGTD